MTHNLPKPERRGVDKQELEEDILESSTLCLFGKDVDQVSAPEEVAYGPVRSRIVRNSDMEKSKYINLANES